MDTRSSSRRSTRTRQSVNYRESPNNTSLVSKSASKKVKDDVREKTPQSHKKRSASDDEEHFSPKKLRNNRTPSSKALESIVTECSPSIEKIDSSSGRRSTRKKSHFVNKNDVKKSSTKKCENPEESIETIEIFDESLNESNDKENKLKPTTLFDEEEDVEGRRLYSFKTPKKREGMTQLANLTPKTPRHHDPNATTPRTPKHQRLSEIQKTPTSRPSASKCTKTPRHVRVEIKKSKISLFFFTNLLPLIFFKNWTRLNFMKSILMMISLPMKAITIQMNHPHHLLRANHLMRKNQWCL